MSITRVYRDRDNKIKVEKFSFDEVKKDLTKFFSHDNRISNRKDSMKILEWGVFVEREDSSTYEIKLSEELAEKVIEYITNLSETDENILKGNTEGKITW